MSLVLFFSLLLSLGLGPFLELALPLWLGCGGVGEGGMGKGFCKRLYVSTVRHYPSFSKVVSCVLAVVMGGHDWFQALASAVGIPGVAGSDTGCDTTDQIVTFPLNPLIQKIYKAISPC